jgi:hypothetical protein
MTQGSCPRFQSFQFLIIARSPPLSASIQKIGKSEDRRPVLVCKHRLAAGAALLLGFLMYSNSE